MALFEWSSEFSVGVAQFDEDHQHLLSLINRLNDAMVEGRGRFFMSQVLQELVAYVGRHFAAEEAAMRRAGYEGLEAHIAEHRKLTRQVVKFSVEFNRSNVSMTIDVLYFLRDWLQSHVLQTDRLYREVLNDAERNLN